MAFHKTFNIRGVIMLTLKVRHADQSEFGFEITEWTRTSAGVVTVIKYDGSSVVVELNDNDVAYITDQSEFGNIIAVYR